MGTLFEFDILSTLQEVMNEQTDEMINRVGSKMDEPAEGETVVGTLHDRDASKLYCAMRQMKAQAESLLAQVPVAPDDAAERELRVKADRLKDLAQLAKAIFWAQLQEQMGLWTKNVGLRKNWTVVTTESGSAQQAIAAKLGNLFRNFGGIEIVEGE